MSNPAVITLAEIQTQIGNFRIEDNIGEAIHFHLGEIRYDLTIDEFNTIALEMEKALEDFLNVEGFHIKEFSTEFLLQKADILPDLKLVKDDTIRLSDLIVDVESKFFGCTLKRLPDSRVVRALNGDSDENNRRMERNYFNQTNQDRLDEMVASIKQHGYPFNGEKIVVFNDKNNILDGQHRAGCLYFLKGNIQVPIVRMYFENNLHNVSSHPGWDRFFKWDRKRVWNFLRKRKRKFIEIKYAIRSKKMALYLRMDRFRHR